MKILSFLTQSPRSLVSRNACFPSETTPSSVVRKARAEVRQTLPGHPLDQHQLQLQLQHYWSRSFQNLPALKEEVHLLLQLLLVLRVALLLRLRLLWLTFVALHLSARGHAAGPTSFCRHQVMTAL